ncbi:hypothetical protein ACIPY6_41675 [Streptomyces sp. NPDC090054]|uniref:hypothetical protein n=1 Tax=Streptomyces sp. NPDC090054 TaxID=3365933 RepID=UPI0037FC3256
MSEWLDRTIRDDHRAKGKLHEYFYELPVPAAETAEGSPSGTVMLRLTAEPLPDFGGGQAREGASKRRETSWKYILRTHTRHTPGGDVVAEPFGGELPFVVTGVGPWEPPPENGFDPDRLAARLLAFVSDWRNPDEPLNADQREWFRWLGPGVKALLPSDEEASAEWLRSRRSSDL